MKKRVSLFIAIILSFNATPAHAAASVSFSSTSFAANYPSATVSVSLSNPKGVQSFELNCPGLFSAIAFPDYSRILLSSSGGIKKYLSTSGARPLTKLVGTVYATTSVSFSFPLGFGQGAISTSGSCTPTITTTDAYGQENISSAGTTLTFVGPNSIKPSPNVSIKPTPTPTSSPNISPTPETSVPKGTRIAGCYPGNLSVGENETEDWRVPEGLPTMANSECINLLSFETDLGILTLQKGKLDRDTKQLILWRLRETPKFSKVKCLYGTAKNASSSLKTAARRDAAVICNYFKSQNPTIRTSLVSYETKDKSRYWLTVTLHK